MDVICCGVGERYADVVNRGGGSFSLAVGRGRDIGFVDADCVVKLYWRERSQVWLKNVGKVREGELLLIEELRRVSR